MKLSEVFNLADASICVAAVIVMVLSVRGIRLDGSRDGLSAQ